MLLCTGWLGRPKTLISEKKRLSKEEVNAQGRRKQMIKTKKDPQVAMCLAYLKKRRVSMAGAEREMKSGRAGTGMHRGLKD